MEHPTTETGFGRNRSFSPRAMIPSLKGILMKSFSKKILLPFFPLLFCAVVLLVVAFLREFGTDSDSYFARGAIFPALAVSLLLISLVFAAISAFRAQSTAPGAFSYAAFPAFFGCILTAIALVRSSLVASPLFFFAALFFAIPVLMKKRSRPLLLLLNPFFGFAAIAAMIYLCVVYYFDMTVEMNAPLKTLLHMGLLFCILYVTAEIRCFLGKGMPRLFRLLSAAATGVGLFTSLPLLIAFLGNTFSRTQYPAYFAGVFAVLGISLTALFRLIGSLIQRPATENEATAENEASTEDAAETTADKTADTAEDTEKRQEPDGQEETADREAER